MAGGMTRSAGGCFVSCLPVWFRPDGTGQRLGQGMDRDVAVTASALREERVRFPRDWVWVMRLRADSSHSV